MLKKYKCLYLVKKTFSFKMISNGNTLVKSDFKLRTDMIRNEIENFLEEDSSSTLCPGKKDTITRKKCKKQKIYLNENLQNLQKDFCSKFPQFHIGYSTFCKFRPFWLYKGNCFSGILAYAPLMKI